LIIQLTDDGEGFDAIEIKLETKTMHIIRERLKLIDLLLAKNIT
jgi:hypothetical protein